GAVAQCDRGGRLAGADGDAVAAVVGYRGRPLHHLRRVRRVVDRAGAASAPRHQALRRCAVRRIGAAMRLIAVAVLVALGGLARADTAGADLSPEVRALVDAWLAAQNRGDFAAYEKLYAQKFTGVRRSGTRTVSLDRAGWMRDRKRMF